MALAIATAELRDAGCDTPRLDAELLLADALGVDRARSCTLATRARADGGRRRDRFARAARAAAGAREPVAYILGRARLPPDRAGGRRARADPAAGDRAARRGGARRCRTARACVDVGTGSGAVALALKHERPDLEVARQRRRAPTRSRSRARTPRALGLDVDVRCRATCSTASPASSTPSLSNPPYVAERDLRDARSPRSRATSRTWRCSRGPDGLDDRAPARAGRRRARAPFVALEVGAGQAPAVAALLRDAGFAAVEVPARPRRASSAWWWGGGELRADAADAAAFERCIERRRRRGVPGRHGLRAGLRSRRAEAVARLYALKGRPADKPAAVMFFDRRRGARRAAGAAAARTRAARRGAAARRRDAAAAQPRAAASRSPAGRPATLGAAACRIPDVPALATVARWPVAAVQRQPRRRRRTRDALDEVPGRRSATAPTSCSTAASCRARRRRWSTCGATRHAASGASCARAPCAARGRSPGRLGIVGRP